VRLPAESPPRRRAVPASRAWLIALAAVPALLAGLPGPAGAQSRQETLIIARNIDDYVTNDVHRTYEYTSNIIDHAAYDTLVTVEAPDFTKIQPNLATRWEVSKDGLTYTFTLRSGAKFASGNPVTARDVRFSLRRLKNLKDNPSFFMDPVKDVEVVSDTTVRIVLSAPDASFLAALSAVPCGIADSKAVMAKGGTDGEDVEEKDKATEWLNGRSEGSGPYRLVSFTKNVEAVLERHPGYWGPRPHFAKVIIKHVPNGTTQREMVERGDADVAMDFDPDIVAAIKPGPRIRIVEGLSMNQIYLALNNSKEVGKELADRRVRQAVSYALDYDGLLKGLMRGAADRPPAMIPLGILGADRALARKRDVARAKQLLAEAGLPNGFEARLSYWTSPLLGVPTEPLAAKLQADLAQAGIRATLEPRERSVGIAEYRAGKPQLILASWTPDFLDPHPWADAFYGGGPVPKRVKYANPKVGEVIAAANREQDAKKREALYHELTRIVLDDAPTIMLIQPKSFVGVNPALKGYAIHPIWFVTVARISR
jgi:peptide/nickel transport system substrate-binding protein